MPNDPWAEFYKRGRESVDPNLYKSRQEEKKPTRWEDDEDPWSSYFKERPAPKFSEKALRESEEEANKPGFWSRMIWGEPEKTKIRQTEEAAGRLEPRSTSERLKRPGFISEVEEGYGNIGKALRRGEGWEALEASNKLFPTFEREAQQREAVRAGLEKDWLPKAGPYSKAASYLDSRWIGSQAGEMFFGSPAGLAGTVLSAGSGSMISRGAQRALAAPGVLTGGAQAAGGARQIWNTGGREGWGQLAGGTATGLMGLFGASKYGAPAPEVLPTPGTVTSQIAGEVVPIPQRSGSLSQLPRRAEPEIASPSGEFSMYPRVQDPWEGKSWDVSQPEAPVPQAPTPRTPGRVIPPASQRGAPPPFTPIPRPVPTPVPDTPSAIFPTTVEPGRVAPFGGKPFGRRYVGPPEEPPVRLGPEEPRLGPEPPELGPEPPPRFGPEEPMLGPEPPTLGPRRPTISEEPVYGMEPVSEPNWWKNLPPVEEEAAPTPPTTTIDPDRLARAKAIATNYNDGKLPNGTDQEILEYAEAIDPDSFPQVTARGEIDIEDFDKNPEAFLPPKGEVVPPEARPQIDPLIDKLRASLPKRPGAIPAEAGPATPSVIGPEAELGPPELGRPNAMEREALGLPKMEAHDIERTRLPKELAGAKPRFNIGTTSYQPEFASDVDKALFIISQKNPSKRDAEYLKFVMDNTGMNEAQARSAGQQVRTKIKGVVKTQPAGYVEIPTLFRPKVVKTPTPLPKTVPLSSPGPVPTLANVITPPTGAVPQAGGPAVPPTTPPIPPSGMGGTPPPPPNTVGVPAPTVPPLKKQPSKIIQGLNLPRGMMAAWDLSAVLRQGVGMAHKKAYRESLKPMMKALWSEEGYKASEDAIRQRDLFRPFVDPQTQTISPSFAEKMGLQLGDLTSMGKREEAIISSWAENLGFDPSAGTTGIPGISKLYAKTYGRGVRATNRAYTAFINNLRAGAFEELVEKGNYLHKGSSINNAEVSKAYAKVVNAATGRGSLGMLESAAPVLNGTMFAPRLLAGRLEMINPVNYYKLPPAARLEAAKSLMTTITYGTTVLGLAKAAGAEVSMDPSSSDFMKAKIGNTRIDPWGGYQQLAVLANRTMNPIGPATGFKGDKFWNRGQMTTTAGGTGKKITSGYGGKGTEHTLWAGEKAGPYDTNTADVMGKFIGQKANPVGGFALSLLRGGKEITGERMNFSTMNPMENAVMQRFIPLFAQDMYELSQSSPELRPAMAVLAPYAFMGGGVQTYEKQETKTGRRRQW